MPFARMIIDPPAPGAWNMAVDEALLEAASRGATTLRLYQWSEATLSLGYFQAAADRAEHTASRECPLVRRASGGGAIVHDRELTYCLAVPMAERFGRAADALFAAVHESLLAALGELGVTAQLVARGLAHGPPPFLCFERRSPGDVVCGAVKIAGSAQRRQRGGLVQHGSILLERSARAPELAGIAEAAGVVLEAADVAERFGSQLARRLGVAWRRSELETGEAQRAAAYACERFAAADWTCRR